MSNGYKIAGIVIFVWISFTASSQIEKGLIPWSNKLLLNPSYAGFKKNTHFWSSLHWNAQPGNRLNNTWAVTYDSWSEKMNGGFAFNFFQGLDGEFNTNTTGAGFSFSKPFEAGKNGQLIPSFSINLHTATKQWFVYVIDRLIDKSFEYQSPPGEEFLRYPGTQPAVGLLWNAVSAEIGLAGFYSFYHNYGEEELQDHPPLHLVLHAAQKMKGKRRGLVSQPVKASPELTILYSENLFLSRVGFRMERTDHQFGVFVRNNFSENVHGIGGAIGWKFRNLRLNFSTGGTYSVPEKNFGFFGEANLGLIIPYLHINENNPWAPPPALF